MKEQKNIIYTEEVAQRCSVKKGALRNFAKFTGKHLCLRPATLFKRNSGTGVFL